MFKAGKIRLFFLISVMAVLALGVGMIGGTFASDFGANTMAESTSYNVDLSYSRGNNAPVSMFATNAAAFTQDLKWYPGKTEIVYLTVDNNENLTLNCALSLAVTKSNFGDMLTYAVIPDLTATTSNHPRSWGAFEATAKQSGVVGTLIAQKELYPLMPKQPLSGGESKNIALAIHMKSTGTDEDNNYQNASMSLHFVLHVDDAASESGSTSAN